MIVNGKIIAQQIVEALLRERSTLPPVLRLGVLMGATDGASDSFVKIKERVADKLQVVVVRELLDDNATTAQALRALERLSKACAGVIVQLPLPTDIDTQEVINALTPEKDIDAVGESSIVEAPVAEAISEVFAQNNVSARGKVAVVVGAGKLVGGPAKQLLSELGAEVHVITQTSGSLSDLKGADIVILGAGEPGLVKPEMLKEGVVLIDAGTSALPAGANREARGRVMGDADRSCAEVASVFTPVPGGIGPIAVAMIFKNLFTLAKRNFDIS